MTIILGIIFIIELFSWYCYAVNIIFQEGGYYRLDIVRQLFPKRFSKLNAMSSTNGYIALLMLSFCFIYRKEICF